MLKPIEIRAYHRGTRELIASTTVYNESDIEWKKGVVVEELSNHAGTSESHTLKNINIEVGDEVGPSAEQKVA